MSGSTHKANQDIGTIKNMAFDADGVKVYIVGVVGFLGLGDRYVAVRPSALNVTFDASDDDKKWDAAIDINAERLKGPL